MSARDGICCRQARGHDFPYCFHVRFADLLRELVRQESIARQDIGRPSRRTRDYRARSQCQRTKRHHIIDTAPLRSICFRDSLLQGARFAAGSRSRPSMFYLLSRRITGHSPSEAPTHSLVIDLTWSVEFSEFDKFVGMRGGSAMQLGMIGLGRMGANMVRRLMKRAPMRDFRQRRRFGGDLQGISPPFRFAQYRRVMAPGQRGRFLAARSDGHGAQGGSGFEPLHR